MRLLIALALVAGMAGACKGKSEAERQTFEEGSPQKAFVDMHQRFRTADAEALWEKSFSTSMKEAMGLKLRIFVDRPAEVVKKETGKTPEELRQLGGKEFYALLLSRPAMKKRLSKGFPVITGTTEVEPGLVDIAYREPAGETCTQRFIKEGDLWKAERGPVCN